MSSTTFEKQGSSLLVKPEGRLDTAASNVLERELHSHLDGVQYLTMDFSEVEYVSSGGLRVLLATEKLLKDRGGTMQVVHVNEYILEVFDLVGFRDVVTVVTD